jgi:hypothetical protein
MKTLKFLFSLLLSAVVIITVNQFLPHPVGIIIGSLVFTAPGGIATPFSFNMNYLPQFLTFNNVVPLTSLRVSTQEDGVLHDYIATSIAVINGFMVPGAQAANIVTLRLANGQLNPKNVTISGVTSAAGAIGFYEFSDQKGTYPFKTSNAQILALNPTTFEKFTAIWVPTMAAVTDTCEVSYSSGHRQIFNINDLTAATPFFQEVPAIMVNNVNSYISSVKFTCVAATPAYILSVKLT